MLRLFEYYMYVLQVQATVAETATLVEKLEAVGEAGRRRESDHKKKALEQVRNM